MSWIQNILSVFTLLPANSGQAGVRELNKKFLLHGRLQPLVIGALVQIHHHLSQVFIKHYWKFSPFENNAFIWCFNSNHRNKQELLYNKVRILYLSR